MGFQNMVVHIMIYFFQSLYIKDNKITPCTSHYTHVGIIFKNLTEGNNLIDFKSKFVKKFLDDEYNNPARTFRK